MARIKEGSSYITHGVTKNIPDLLVQKNYISFRHRAFRGELFYQLQKIFHWLLPLLKVRRQ